MDCKTDGQNESFFLQFNKIRLLSDIGNHIARYGVQCGLKTLMDDVDLNCGAVPEGEFEQVIDLSSAHQFLSMYTKIAENRFAFVVTALLKANADFMPILVEFCGRIGKDMNLEFIPDAKTAFEVFESYILDGMPCEETKKITLNTADIVQWEKLADTHEDSWKKAGGEVSVYYKLQQCFVSGLLEKSGIKFENNGGKSFSLTKEL